MTKKSADINYISKDLFPKTYNRTMIDDDYIKQLEQENEKLKDNWVKLKEYLFDIRKRGFALQNLANVTKNTEPGIAILIIIDKMLELERGVSDDNN